MTQNYSVGVKDKPGVAATIFKPLFKTLNVDMVAQNIF